MILIEKVEEYGARLIATVPELKICLLVCDDSQLADVMKDITHSDNIILVAFIPSHEVLGTNVDNVQDLDSLLWMALEKTDVKDGHQEMINSFKRTQIAIKKIKNQMLEDKPNFSDCGNTMKKLEVASIKIDPIWRLAGTNGYELNYRLITPSY